MSTPQYKRTHDCGSLRKTDIDKKINLSGWVNRRRDHGGLIFIDLRDRYGIVQLVFDPKISETLHKEASKLRSEWVISVSGTVSHRGENLINPKLATGEIEVNVESLNIISVAKTPPFSICDDTIDVHEELRLKHRYLDIRRGQIIHNLEIRHKALHVIRNFLNSHSFLEVSTPILAKSTPEGARDYLVPSRIYPGNFYALPQSPQIFKQLLMVSGVDRYYQVAPCFRDEDLRSDRQPEFTQIDIEASFLDSEDIYSLCETMLTKIFKECLDIDISTPFPRMTHSECIERYGTDKPDLRFQMPLVRLDDIIEASNFDLLKDYLQNNGCVKAICVKNGADFSRREIDEFVSFVSPFNLRGLAWMKKTQEGFSSNIVKFFSVDLLQKLEKRMNAENNDLILIAAEKDTIVNQGMDHLRRHIAKKQGLIDKSSYRFLWVTNFPMFSKDETTNELKAEHHPFTQPNHEDISLLETNPLQVRSLAYDLVVNGYELAGGSQRIHDQEIQEKVFNALKLEAKDIDEKFGFFIEALKYGTPPHLGIAFGLDRLIMLLCKTENIRDVIAFPKTQKASDLMMQAPSEPLKGHLAELKIKSEATEIHWN
ncbi:MAG: aspartate--tRNA ligase [Chlamydiota bacterium]|jgi:aspartyl-tRNA synthetase